MLGVARGALANCCNEVTAIVSVHTISTVPNCLEVGVKANRHAKTETTAGWCKDASRRNRRAYVLCIQPSLLAAS
jgi:hypothetical protein